jgi:hypothetical protein
MNRETARAQLDSHNRDNQDEWGVLSSAHSAPEPLMENQKTLPCTTSDQSTRTHLALHSSHHWDAFFGIVDRCLTRFPSALNQASRVEID